MNYRNILSCIINTIKPVNIAGSGNDLFSKVCTIIKMQSPVYNILS